MNMINRNPSFTEDGASSAGTTKGVEVDQDVLELNDTATAATEESETEVETTDESTEADTTTGTSDDATEADESVDESTETSDEQSVVIGDKTYTQAELATIVAKGSKVMEYEIKTPGFNIDTLVPEFTRKSQRLAQYEKQLASTGQLTPDELKNLGVEPEQVQLFEKLAKGLGFVRQHDLAERSVEAQKDTFLERHPEYLPTAQGGNDRWGKLMGEFSIYNWQANPHLVESLLEESHKKIAAPLAEAKRGQKTKKQIVSSQKLTQLAATGGGGSKAGSAPAKATLDQSQLAKYRAAGWSDQDIKELLT